MKYVLIVIVIFALIIYWLYCIGKKVKQKEAEIEKIIKGMKTKQKYAKYQRKSTPKVPKK